MDRNPYAPPTAQVADPSANDAPAAQRPAMVALAVKLLWAATAVSLIGVALVWGKIMEMPEVVSMPAGAKPVVMVIMAVMFGGSYALWCWLIVKIGRGRNWARVLLTILLGLSLLSNLMKSDVDVGLFGKALNVVTMLIEIAAIVMLYLPASRPWFNQDRAVR
jgi:hypothetical protein